MSVRSRLLRSLLAGLGVVIPFVLVFYLGWQLLQWTVGLAELLAVFTTWLGLTGIEGRIVAGVIAVGAVVGGLVALGVVIRNRIGAWAIGIVDRLIEEIPILGQLYRGLRNIRTVLLDSEQTPFEDVVLVELSDGVSVLGFTVGNTHPKLQAAQATEGVAVYVPLAPNPTVGGHLLVVDPEALTKTTLSRTAALSAIVTLGAGDEQSAESTPLRGLYHQPPEDTPTD